MTNYEYILGLNNRGICNGFMKLSEQNKAQKYKNN